MVIANMTSENFPYQSKFINILNSKIHYIDENNCDDTSQVTFICVHGNPSSSYIWRNIISFLLPKGRVIAMDLVGFGKSDKPNIDYRVLTHSNYFDEFINELNLNNIIFVLHDWGTTLGLSYARRNSEKIKGVAFMEGIIRPKKWDFGNPFVRLIFRLFRTPIVGKLMIINGNFFVERILLSIGQKRKLTKTEKNYYRQPFLKKQNRKPIYVFPNEIPINGKPKDVYEMVNKNHEWLKTSDVPKLLLWIKTGVLIKPNHVQEMKNDYKNIEVEYVGESSHYLQEDFPTEIGQSIVNWNQRINRKQKYEQ